MGVGWEEERRSQIGGQHFSLPQSWQHFLLATILAKKKLGQHFGNILFLKVGKCQDGEFLGKAAAVCKEYMARDPTSLSFTVLALTASD